MVSEKGLVLTGSGGSCAQQNDAASCWSGWDGRDDKRGNLAGSGWFWLVLAGSGWSCAQQNDAASCWSGWYWLVRRILSEDDNDSLSVAETGLNNPNVTDPIGTVRSSMK
jgi:hypothetical protein